MPAHLHPGPPCRAIGGRPCAPGTTCQHDPCLWGGRLLQCVQRPDGLYRCFHAEYYLGNDILPDTPVPKPSPLLDSVPPAYLAETPGTFEAWRNRFKLHPEGFSVAQVRAFEIVEAFVQRADRGAFPNVNRKEVAQGLVSRIKRPELIDQGSNNLCGPAAFMHCMARQDPAGYAQFVVALYDRGYAQLGGLEIRPSTSFRFDHKPDGTAAVDWIALGSLRDSTNWFFEYHRNELPFLNARSDTITWEGLRGGTSSADMAGWFRKVGFRDVVSQENWFFCADEENLKRASEYYRKGYKVCLAVSANFLLGRTQAEVKKGGACDHYVVLASPIEVGATVRFKMFTWGYYSDSPAYLTPKEFLNSYYGFTAARR